MIDRISIQRKPTVGHTSTAPASSPCEIEVHIEELILHGYDSRPRRKVAYASESELLGLLASTSGETGKQLVGGTSLGGGG